MNRLLHGGAVALATILLVSACAGGPTQRSTGVAVDDAVVLSRVKAALVSNDATKARQIDVEVYKGEVQLNGFVDTEAAKAAATTTARNVEGATSVRNNLQIKAAERSAGQMVDDGVITAKVKSSLIGDPRTKAYEIEVAVNSGVVQLGGFVSNAAGKMAATEVARAVDGVSSVENGLQVKN